MQNNLAFKDVIKQYQYSVETVYGKDTSEYIESLLDEARWISINVDRVEGYHKWVKLLDQIEKVFGNKINEQTSSWYLLMIVIKFELGLYQEVLELINQWREVEVKIRSTNSKISIVWDDYEKKIFDIQKKEEENQKANQKSILNKLIPNTPAKAAVYITLIFAAGFGLVYLSKKRQSN